MTRKSKHIQNKEEYLSNLASDFNVRANLLEKLESIIKVYQDKKTDHEDMKKNNEISVKNIIAFSDSKENFTKKSIFNINSIEVDFNSFKIELHQYEMLVKDISNKLLDIEDNNYKRFKSLKLLEKKYNSFVGKDDSYRKAELDDMLLAFNNEVKYVLSSIDNENGLQDKLSKLIGFQVKKIDFNMKYFYDLDNSLNQLEKSKELSLKLQVIYNTEFIEIKDEALKNIVASGNIQSQYETEIIPTYYGLETKIHELREENELPKYLEELEDLKEEINNDLGKPYFNLETGNLKKLIDLVDNQFEIVKKSGKNTKQIEADLEATINIVEVAKPLLVEFNEIALKEKEKLNLWLSATAKILLM